jgi:outer membrane lipoprotein carrier protein
MKLKETEDMRAPLAFLLGKLNFDKEFQKIQAKPDGDATVITAEPKAGNLPYAKVEFTVSPAFEIRKLKVSNLDQSVLEFVFDTEKLNPPLANTLFEFRTPPGAEVVEGG